MMDNRENQSVKQLENDGIPQNILRRIRDLVYQSRGSIIPHFRKHFDFDSLYAARFTETHEGAPFPIDIIAFNDIDEKRYLVEMHLDSKELPMDIESKVMDEEFYLVVGIKGTFDESKLEFLAWVDELESPMIVDPLYDRYKLAEPILLHSRKSMMYQRCIRR